MENIKIMVLFVLIKIDIIIDLYAHIYEEIDKEEANMFDETIKIN